MRRLLVIAMLATSTAHAGEIIASRVAPASTPNQVLTLELSNTPGEQGICNPVDFMGRIMLSSPKPNTPPSRLNLGCWHFTKEVKVMYEGWDQVNKKQIHLELPIDTFTLTPDFTAWIDYMER